MQEEAKFKRANKPLKMLIVKLRSSDIP